MFKSIFKTTKFILNHPLSGRHKWRSVLRYIKYQLNKAINPYPIVYSFTNKAKLVIEPGMTGATGNLYCGLHEFWEMGFLLHFLKPNDLFVDVGANVGTYTVLASGHIGCRAIAFEPIYTTYKRLLNNIAINHIESKVSAYNIGVGAERKFLRFTDSLDTVNHVVEEQESIESVEVEVNTLDSILPEHQVALLKIDVEGYETEVLSGAENLFAEGRVKAVIIELNGSGRKYGFKDEDIHNRFLKYGFKPFQYDPFTRKLSTIPSYGQTNTIYIKDWCTAEAIVRNAPSFKVVGEEI